MTVALGTNIANPISTALSQWLGFDTMGKLANYGKLGVTDPDAVIKALFASGEQGAWYDPSDLSTMFQDRAGTTPVTADGQPVGLILDKSKGLVLGAERMIVPISGSVSGSWLISGSGVITRNGSTGGQASCGTNGNVNLELSKIFLVSFTVADFSGDSLLLRVGGGTAVQISGNGAKSLRIASGGTPAVIFAPWGGTVGQATITGLTVKEIAGNHATAPNDAARPLYKTSGGYHWLQFDGVDDALATAAIDFTATDKMSVFVGITNDRNSPVQGFITLGAPTTEGNFLNWLPGVSGQNIYELGQFSGTNSYARWTAPPPPYTSVITELMDLAQTLVTNRYRWRENGTQLTQIAGYSAGTAGVFQNAALEIAQIGNGAPYSGRIYPLIVLGRLATPQEITDTETWVNGKTGAY